MGNIRRLIRSATLLAALLTLVAACSSSSGATEEKRRVLLTPPAAALKPKPKPPPITDKEGVPLPSDLVLAGLPVPRGFELGKSYENEWFLRSTSVSAEATGRYIEARVFTGQLERTSVGGLRFELAQLREAPSLPRLSIRISPTKGHKRACELYIRRIPVQKQVTRSADEIARTLQENARYAQ
jgi:hypothetical protein